MPDWRAKIALTSSASQKLWAFDAVSFQEGCACCFPTERQVSVKAAAVKFVHRENFEGAKPARGNDIVWPVQACKWLNSCSEVGKSLACKIQCVDRGHSRGQALAAATDTTNYNVPVLE
jgi:hypothetical protein